MTVLKELTGTEADFLKPTSERQCKDWASVLKSNLGRIMVLEGENKRLRKKYDFLVIEGSDINSEFSHGYYAPIAIDSIPSWDHAKVLGGELKEDLEEFIGFLDSCGGIAKVG